MSTEFKWRRVPRYLAAGNSLDRFQAERVVGDHSLNSTVAELQGMGVSISREPIVLQGRYGDIHCKKYWLEPAQRDRAKALLASR